ncbi:hypothetical protein [Streptomyces sp. Isolate_219]|uniref:hypothetical protein n=1 Tax=Streptomyces sp. Isolate_219 TaxID=2950110 RepID=UPI0021C77EAB|nr:hypothetical protein [Streptomyces sp. Isolate_219]MCR8574535.1 hypothetical protein [Streptomyces sp. Isolate_219]
MSATSRTPGRFPALLGGLHEIQHIERGALRHRPPALPHRPPGRRPAGGAPAQGNHRALDRCDLRLSGARTLDEVAGALIARGRLTADGDTLALTEAGRRTRAEVATLVDAGRARLMRGLTDDDYLRTVTVLDRMTANLTPGR